MNTKSNLTKKTATRKGRTTPKTVTKKSVGKACSRTKNKKEAEVKVVSADAVEMEKDLIHALSRIDRYKSKGKKAGSRIKSLGEAFVDSERNCEILTGKLLKREAFILRVASLLNCPANENIMHDIIVRGKEATTELAVVKRGLRAFV